MWLRRGWAEGERCQLVINQYCILRFSPRTTLVHLFLFPPTLSSESNVNVMLMREVAINGRWIGLGDESLHRTFVFCLLFLRLQHPSNISISHIHCPLSKQEEEKNLKGEARQRQLNLNSLFHFPTPT